MPKVATGKRGAGCGAQGAGSVAQDAGCKMHSAGAGCWPQATGRRAQRRAQGPGAGYGAQPVGLRAQSAGRSKRGPHPCGMRVKPVKPRATRDETAWQACETSEMKETRRNPIRIFCSLRFHWFHTPATRFHSWFLGASPVSHACHMKKHQCRNASCIEPWEGAMSEQSEWIPCLHVLFSST